jgi:sugar phosphate isomerase/epimerase
MQLGIGTYTYGWCFDQHKNSGLPLMTELDLINKAKEFNVHLLQIGDNLPLHTFGENRLATFEKELEQNNIRIEIGARGITTAHLQRYIHLCKRFGATILRFIIDSDEYKPTINEVAEIILSALHDLEANNISLALENHDRLKAKEYAAIIEQVNSKYAGICLDTVNSMGAAEGLETIVEILAPHTLNLHIKDFGISRLPCKQGFIIDGRIAGKGLLDLPLLLNKLKQFGKCNTAILEQWVPFENDINQTQIKELSWAEESMKYLGPLLNN